MKDRLEDANFPRDAEGRTYHVGTKLGQVANRIITVGEQTRARRIARHFDGGAPLFEHESGRKFLTLTGTYRGTPITVISIGMGFSLVDFFVRECRAVVDGEMAIVRLGSCGSIAPSVTLGNVVVPLETFGVTRNYDHFHPSRAAKEEEQASAASEPYLLTKSLDCDRTIHDALLRALNATRPAAKPETFDGVRPRAIGEVVNASADSFYSSQGRQDASFQDENHELITRIRREKPGAQTFEMETFVLAHLALCANRALESAEAEVGQGAGGNVTGAKRRNGRIRVGAAQMVFADRTSQRFITPEEVRELECWAGKAACDALVGLEVEGQSFDVETYTRFAKSRTNDKCGKDQGKARAKRSSWPFLLASVAGLVALLLGLQTWFAGSNLAAIQRGGSPIERALILTAHPDDEAMFFAPLVQALHRGGVEVHGLCLSKGDADGLGDIRSEELRRAYGQLGVSPGKVTLIDDPELQDGMDTVWRAPKIAAAVGEVVDRQRIDTIFTFDDQGVSGHANHVAISHALPLILAKPTRRVEASQSLLGGFRSRGKGAASATKSSGRLRAFRLRSAPLVFKYLGLPYALVHHADALRGGRVRRWLGHGVALVMGCATKEDEGGGQVRRALLPIDWRGYGSPHATLCSPSGASTTTPTTTLSVLSSPHEYVTSVRAMRHHASQLVWFRWLYVLTSAHMVHAVVDEVSVGV